MDFPTQRRLGGFCLFAGLPPRRPDTRHGQWIINPNALGQWDRAPRRAPTICE